MEVKLTNEHIKEILDGAPDEATHIDDDWCYLKYDDNFRWHLHRALTGWFCIDSNIIGAYGDICSLEHLREILALRIKNEQLKAEIEQICNEESDGVNDV
jgi:hypothetical protein